jgi:hypothetical protein
MIESRFTKLNYAGINQIHEPEDKSWILNSASSCILTHMRNTIKRNHRTNRYILEQSALNSTKFSYARYMVGAIHNLILIKKDVDWFLSRDGISASDITTTIKRCAAGYNSEEQFDDCDGYLWLYCRVIRHTLKDTSSTSRKRSISHAATPTN